MFGLDAARGARAPPRGRARRPAPGPRHARPLGRSRCSTRASRCSARCAREGRRQAEGADGLGDAIAELIGAHRRLGARAARGRPAELAGALDSMPDGLLRALTEYEEHRLRENLAPRPRSSTLVEADLRASPPSRRALAELTRAIREVGEVISTLPSPGDAQRVADPLLAAGRERSRRRASSRARLELPSAAVRVRAARAPSRPAAARVAAAARQRRSPPSPVRATADSRARIAEVDQRDGARRHPASSTS